MQQLSEILTLDCGGVEWQHEVVAGLPQLLDTAVRGTVDETSSVVVQDSSEGGGGVTCCNLILSLLIHLRTNVVFK